MDDSAFSDDFCRFIQTSVPSVDAAELLLRLADEPQRWWDPAALPEPGAPRLLEQLQASGLIALGPDRRVQLRPADERLQGHLRTLAQAYRERPVTLIRMIYALRDTRIQTFADAFKIRR